MDFIDYEKNSTLVLKKNSTLVQVEEILEIFTDFADLKYISYYSYDYEHNDFIYKFTMTNKGSKIEKPEEEEKSYKIFFRKNKITYGYIKIHKRILIYSVVRSNVLKKLIRKVTTHLEEQKFLEKSLYSHKNTFNITVIAKEELSAFRSNLTIGLNALFNTDVAEDDDIKKYKKANKKNIIIFIIDKKYDLEKVEDILRSLNQLIIVIGPNSHKLSSYCGSLGIVDYFSITDFKAENIKSIILKKKDYIFNKNTLENKTVLVSGISGGIGTTSISLNIANILADEMTNSNTLYIDLSTTKAVSNLFLNSDPIPNKNLIDIISLGDFNISNNLENGLVKVSNNFYYLVGIQQQTDIEYLNKEIFIENLVKYIAQASKFFNYVIIDIGLADGTNLKTTLYELANEIWVLTDVSIPNISKLKTFYSLLKKAGLKDKFSILINKFDKQNNISFNDMSSILNLTKSEKSILLEPYLPFDYQNMSYCWNHCKTLTSYENDSEILNNLKMLLANKKFFEIKEQKKEKKSFFGRIKF